jgi:uncharacterized RDD family membrane protein YckC
MYQTRYASIPKRFVAFVVDGLLSSLIAAALFIPLLTFFFPLVSLREFMFGGLFFPTHSAFPFHNHGLPWPVLSLSVLFSFLALFLVSWFYFALFESSARQATPGKMMLGLFVTDLEGRRISFARALGRTLAKVLSKAFCYLGYIAAIFTQRNQALHDMLAATLVLEPSYQPPYVEQNLPAAPR